MLWYNLALTKPITLEVYHGWINVSWHVRRYHLFYH